MRSAVRLPWPTSSTYRIMVSGERRPRGSRPTNRYDFVSHLITTEHAGGTSSPDMCRVHHAGRRLTFGVMGANALNVGGK